MKFKFEIVQTVNGSPDPSSYPQGQAHTTELDGAAMVVTEEFPDETQAKAQQCTHDDGWRSDVWNKHCPNHFKNTNSIGGFDVFYIGPAHP